MPPDASRDLTLWAAEQAALLRQGRVAEVDVQQVAAEIESLGARQGEALRDHLTVLVCRLVLWKYMPGARLPFWRVDIADRRETIAGLLAASPSLDGRLAVLFVEAYALGRRRAAAEAGIDADLLPDRCPFTLDQARSERFLPSEPDLEVLAP